MLLLGARSIAVMVMARAVAVPRLIVGRVSQPATRRSIVARSLAAVVVEVGGRAGGGAQAVVVARGRRAVLGAEVVVVAKVVAVVHGLSGSHAGRRVVQQMGPIARG
jgi:hypothetical protein